MFRKVKKLNHEGKGIIYTKSKILKIAHVLPNEVIEINSKQVIKPSKYRVEPFCEFYYNCTGCNLQIANYEYQKKLKMKFIERVLRKANLNIQIEDIEPSKSSHYLNIYDRNYYNIKVDSCPLLYENINEILNTFPKSAIIRGSDRLKDFIVLFGSQKLINKKYITEVFNTRSDISGIAVKEENLIKPILGNTFYKERILNKTLKISFLSDFDKNIEIFERKIKYLRKIMEKYEVKRGIFLKSEYYPVFLYEYLEYIHAIERNGYNRKDLEEILKNYDILNCTILSSKASSAIRASKDFDLILLNKPFLRYFKYIKENPFKNIVVILDKIKQLYPILKMMKSINYEILEIKAFDSFPHIFKFEIILFFRNSVSSTFFNKTN
ncbi:MAG: hypothetical protein RMJ38_02560 [candidate division WOR-3 bacterium]|nr:hypothetical protein [candidate division WOR-3 bacterium]MDW8150309.1 hypothetical protein [candidate division WOR-3 bacterium]